MILACPNCSTKFRVPDNAIGSQGRVVKCAKCAHSWKATTADAVEDTPPAKKVVKKAAAKRPAPAKRMVKKAVAKRPVAAAAPPRPAPPPPPPPVAEPVEEPVVEDVVETSSNDDVDDIFAEAAVEAGVSADADPTEAAVSDDVAAQQPMPEETVPEVDVTPEPQAPSAPVTDVGMSADGLEQALLALAAAVDAKERGDDEEEIEMPDMEEIASQDPEEVSAALDEARDKAGMPSLSMDPPPIPPRNIKKVKVKRVVKKKTRSPLKAFLILLFFVGLFGGVAFALSKDIVRSFPPAKKVYAMFGIHPDIVGFGLDLPDPVFEREVNGEDETLIIKGEVVNTTSEVVRVPYLRGSLLNTDKEEVYVWFYEADTNEALPGESVKYETSLVNPPVGAISMEVSFATEAEVKRSMEDAEEEKKDQEQQDDNH